MLWLPLEMSLSDLFGSTMHSDHSRLGLNLMRCSVDYRKSVSSWVRGADGC